MRRYDYRINSSRAQVVVPFAQKLRHQLQNAPQVYHDGRAFRLCAGAHGTKAYMVHGLLPSLQKSFWPDFDYTVQSNQGTRASAKSVQSKSKKKKFRLSGKEHGSYIHHQIETVTNGNPQVATPIKTRDVLANPFVDEQTKKALISFEKWGLTKVVSELPVYDPELGIATAVDLVCHDLNGGVVLIELKTNSPNTFFCGQGVVGMHSNVLCKIDRIQFHKSIRKKKTGKNIKGEMGISTPDTITTIKRWNNSPRNQALLQLLFTKMIFERDKNIKVRAAYVVHITDDLVTPHTLPDWLIARENLLYNELLDKME